MTEFSAIPEPLTSVNGNHFAIYEAGIFRQEICGEVCNFLMIPDTFQGNAIGRIKFLREVSRQQSRPGALCRERTRGDGIAANVVLCPFYRQRPGEGEHTGFTTRGRYHIAGTCPRIGGYNVKEYTGLLFDDPVLSGGKGKVIRSLQYDIHNGIEGPVREPFCRTDKISRGIVEYAVNWSEPFL